MYGLVEFSVVPIGSSSTSVSRFVKIAHNIIKRSEFKFELSSMGTILEGDIEKILTLILNINNEIESLGVKRILTNIKVDYRVDKVSTIAGKLESIK